MAETPEKVCVGVFAGAHGVRGLVKIRSFTVNPGDILAYDALYDETFTHAFKPMEKSLNKDVLIVAIEGINDRDKALELKGLKLYVRRDALAKLPEETFYHVDLIGLSVFTTDGVQKGKVAEVFNFGAGDVLGVKTPDGAQVMIPFTKKDVPEVDIKERKITTASNQWFGGKEEGKREDV